jgi:predicted GTPase
MGYGDQQVKDLEATIEATPCDVVLSGTPIDLTRVLKVSKPMTRVRYDLAEIREGVLEGEIRKVLGL